jgi:hypothetical protein
MSDNIDFDGLLSDDDSNENDSHSDKEFEKDLNDLFLDGYNHNDEPLDFLENYY